MDFATVRNVVFESHGRGAYEAGLQAIEDHQASNEDEQVDLAYWKMCLLSRLGRLEEACSVFARSLDHGFWWSEDVLLVGTDDWVLDDTRRAAQGLEASGASVRLEECDGLGHEWPPASGEWLRQAITWVMKSGTNV